MPDKSFLSWPFFEDHHRTLAAALDTWCERELRDFVSTRLADFKVPRKVVFLAEIPKGATGKLQRIGLAAKLGLTA